MNTYPYGWKALMRGQINLEGGSIKMVIVETSCVRNAADQTLTAVLARGGGEVDKTAGNTRKTLTTPVVSVSGEITKFTSDPVDFDGIDSSDTAIAAVGYYDPGTGDANCIPLWYSDAPDQVLSAGVVSTVRYTPDATLGWMDNDAT